MNSQYVPRMVLPILTLKPGQTNSLAERDVKAGRLDRLAAEALRDLRDGRCTDL